MKPSLFLGYMGLHPVLRQADDLQRSLAERCLRICTPSTRAIRAGHCGRLHMTSALYPAFPFFLCRMEFALLLRLALAGTGDYSPKGSH